MLAGCSSTLLSPRHRLRSEASAQFQACHIPTMSTQRLDIPCNFARKDASRSHSQPVRPVGISVEKKPIEAKTSGCSLRIENRDDFWDRSKSMKKRYAGEVSFDDEEGSYSNRAKRKRGNGKSDGGLLGGGEEDNFWFHQGFSTPLSYSGDVMVPPLPPLSNIPWFESVVTEITGLGKKNVEETRKAAPEKETSGGSATSTSSESHHGLVLGPSGNPVEHEIGNGSSPPRPSDSGQVLLPSGHNDENNLTEHQCIELISLLVACVDQIGARNVPAVSHCLARLGEIASPRGSPMHRLIAYFTEALALRVARLWPHIFHVTPPREVDRAVDEESAGGTALRLLNQVSPIPKFIHFTANEILLRAFEGKDRVHIIDFDVKQGLQWPGLFQSLASRSNPPSHIRITGIGESKQELIETGDRLAGFAEALNLPFEFHPVVDRLEDVRLWMLHVKEGETVAVNCVFQLHKMLYDATGGIVGDFLGLIRSTNAEVVVMAEQEGNHNEASLDARLSNSLRYYSAIFDSLDLSLPSESKARVKIEEMFGREIRNIIGCEGRERTERHQDFDKWREVMERGGFGHMGIGERELVQGQMMLKMHATSCESYRVEKRDREGASITLSWSDQPIYTVSAWKPVGGGSSSYAQPS